MPQVNFGHVVVWAEAADRLVQGLELKGVCYGVVIECVAMGARTVGAVGLGIAPNALITVGFCVVTT